MSKLNFKLIKIQAKDINYNPIQNATIKVIKRQTSKILFFIITFISLVNAQSSEVAKPSFDCAKATTKVEKMICSDESGELQELDSIMTLKYKEIKSQLTFKDRKEGSTHLKKLERWFKIQ